jgi:acetyl-CoA acetyltransferase
MTRFGPQRAGGARELVEEALEEALQDAEVEAHDVQAAYVGNAVAGLMTGQESIRAQVVLRRTGLMGVPMVNVENACASSSTALHLGWQAVAGGMHDCVVVIGYETLSHEDREAAWRAFASATDPEEAAEILGPEATPRRNLFAEIYGAMSSGSGEDFYEPEALALVSVKNHLHGSLNPLANYRREVTVDEVLASPRVAGALTRLMCLSLTDGAACLVLTSADFRRGRTGGVKVAASVLVSGRGDDMRQPHAFEQGPSAAYEASGVGPEDLDVIELHDATAVGELMQCGRIGLCALDEAPRLLRDRVTWLGGRVPVNPSGGLLARGHPIGATGAAQVVELAWQLEGRCGQRQVPSARLGLALNIGGWVGSDLAACAVHILQV